jgi:hypothetical protein
VNEGEVPGYSRVKHAIVRLTAVFAAVPGSRLTVPEAATLSGVDVPLCRIVLEALTDSGFLKQQAGGVFLRRGVDSRES